MESGIRDKTVWVSFIDEYGSEVQGYFKLIEQTANYIKMRKWNEHDYNSLS